MTYAELAKERDDLKSENAMLRGIMDKMLAKGEALKEEVKALQEKNKQYLDSIERLTVGKCALKCPLVEQARKDKVMEIYKRLCNVEYSIYDDAHGYAGALASEFEKIFNEHGMEVEE